MNNFRKCEYDVIIVGSGISGLAAARVLVDNSALKVVVLEADENRYGGRVWSYPIPGTNGKSIDLGAVWLHNGSHPDHPLTALARNHHLDLVENDYFCDVISSKTHIRQFHQLNGSKVDSAETAWAKVGKFYETLDQHLEHEKRDDVTLDKVIHKLLDENEDFNCDEILYHAVPSTESYYGAELNTVSSRFCEGIPDSDDEELKFDNSHDTILKHGNSQLLDILLTQGNRFPLKLGHQVQKIVHFGPNVIVMTSSGKVFLSNQVIVTVPLGVLQNRQIDFQPQLPREYLQSIDNMGMGNNVKVVMVFDHIFWPENVDYFCCQTDQPIGMPSGVVNYFTINGTKALMAFCSGKATQLCDSTTEKELSELMLDLFRKMFGSDKVDSSNLLHCKVTRWKLDPNFRGSYSYAKIGMTKEDACCLRQPVGGAVFFAGEHTALPENQQGTMLGAYLSGLRAARQVLTLRGALARSNLSTPHDEKLPVFLSRL